MLAITKAIIKLIDPSGVKPDFVQSDPKGLPSHHSRPLYMMAIIRDVELKLALVAL